YPGFINSTLLGFKVVINKDLTSATTIVNTGEVTFEDQRDTDKASTTVSIYPGPRLHIEKRVDEAMAYAGDTLLYTLIVSNFGATVAENVDVEDYIPAYMTYVPGSSFGSSYNSSSELLTWTVDYIEAGNPVYLSFRAVIDKDTPDHTEIINTGTIVLPDGNKSDDVKTTVLPSPTSNLTIIKRVDLATAFAGDTLTYTLSISNIGEETARNIKLEDSIPDYTVYVTGSATNATYDDTNDLLNWSIDILEPGITVGRSFRAVTDSDTPIQTEIVNIGTIILPDGNKSDDARTTILPTPAPILDIEKSVDLATAFAGDTLTYTLVVSNLGDANASVVDVEDYMPSYTTYINGSSSDGTYNGGSKSLSWIINNLNAGATSTKTFKVAIDDNTPNQTDIENIGSILFPDESKLSDTANTIVQDKLTPKLDISKIVNKASAYAGDTLTYTITIQNTGDAGDESVWVADPIPLNATYIDGSVTGGGDYSNQEKTVNWNIAVPAGGSSPDLTFKVTIDDATPAQTEIENIGSILFPDDSKLSDTAKTIVLETPEPDIEISKEVDSLIAGPGSILTYSLEFTNTGNTPITQITAWDKLPDLTEYVDSSATAGGTYDATENQVNWNWQVGSIAPGHSINLSFKVKIDSNAQHGARITNIGSAALPAEQFIARKINSTEFYPTLDTVNSNQVTTIVDIKTGEDDLAIYKEVSDSYTSPRNILTYSLTITNTGSETLNDIVFTDTIPNLTEYIPGSATGGAVYDGTYSSLSWTIGSLEYNESVKYQFDVKVDVDATDQAVITNQAFIIEPTAIDGNIVATTVLRERISVVKSVDKTQVTKGDTLTYTVDYTNNSLADL
ncbi:MAG: DUF11 domain-containing protein, partial [candidate division Zixibacteria bacterium]|nr:DUF11 domain-containing protein [candidate division Zixibacteria bacterium]